MQRRCLTYIQILNYRNEMVFDIQEFVNLLKFVWHIVHLKKGNHILICSRSLLSNSHRSCGRQLYHHYFPSYCSWSFNNHTHSKTNTIIVRSNRFIQLHVNLMLILVICWFNLLFTKKLGDESSLRFFILSLITYFSKFH